MKNLDHLRVALRVLDSEQAPTDSLWKWLAERELESDVRAITASDRAWPLLSACSIGEHLTAEE